MHVVQEYICESFFIRIYMRHSKYSSISLIVESFLLENSGMLGKILV
jgi:hypothetical protein